MRIRRTGRGFIAWLAVLLLALWAVPAAIAGGIQLLDNVSLAHAHSGDPAHWKSWTTPLPTSLQSGFWFLSVALAVLVMVPAITLAVVYLLAGAHRRIVSAVVVIAAALASVAVYYALTGSDTTPSDNLAGVHVGWAMLMTAIPLLLLALIASVLFRREQALAHDQVGRHS